MTLITFDFHNTLAECDDWFQLEIRTLPLAVYAAMNQSSGASPEHIAPEDIVHAYRTLRGEVVASGIERDALDCVNTTFNRLGYDPDPSLVALHIDRLMDEATRDVQPIPGARELVTDLHSMGFQLGVVSSAIYHPFLEWTLASFGIAHCFDFVVTSASCGFYKSSTRIYEHALTLGQTAASAATHIGDSRRWDVTTAKSLGMRTVLLGSHPPDSLIDTQLAIADLTVSTFVGARNAIVELAKMERLP